MAPSSDPSGETSPRPFYMSGCHHDDSAHRRLGREPRFKQLGVLVSGHIGRPKRQRMGGGASGWSGIDTDPVIFASRGGNKA